MRVDKADIFAGPKDLGNFCEQKALEFFEKQGWTLVARNKKIAGVEIDLIMENTDYFLLTEVKSDNSWRREHPMSLSQKKRLKKAFSVFCEQTKKPTKIYLSIVNKKGYVSVLDMEF